MRSPREADDKFASAVGAGVCSDTAKLAGGEAALAFEDYSVYDPFKLLLTASLRLIAGAPLCGAAGCNVGAVQGNV